MTEINQFILALTALITSIAGLIVAVNKFNKSVKSVLPKKIKKQALVDLKIMEQLEKLKEYLNADRIELFDFHNGGHYANGRSALKMSCSFETVRVGIPPKQNFLQNIPLSCIPRFLAKIIKNQVLKVTNVEDIRTEMPATYDMKKGIQVKSFYNIILNNSNYEPIGFIAIQYIKNPYSVTPDNEVEILVAKNFIEAQLEELNSSK